MFGCPPSELKQDLREYRDCHYQSPFEKERGARMCQCGETCEHVTFLLAWRNYFVVAVIPIVLMFVCPLLFGGDSDSRDQNNQVYSSDAAGTFYNTNYLQESYMDTDRTSMYQAPALYSETRYFSGSHLSFNSSPPAGFGLPENAPRKNAENAVEKDKTNREIRYQIDQRRFPPGSAYALDGSSHASIFGKPRVTTIVDR